MPADHEPWQLQAWMRRVFGGAEKMSPVCSLIVRVDGPGVGLDDDGVVVFVGCVGEVVDVGTVGAVGAVGGVGLEGPDLDGLIARCCGFDFSVSATRGRLFFPYIASYIVGCDMLSSVEGRLREVVFGSGGGISARELMTCTAAVRSDSSYTWCENRSWSDALPSPATAAVDLKLKQVANHSSLNS